MGYIERVCELLVPCEVVAEPDNDLHESPANLVRFLESDTTVKSSCGVKHKVSLLLIFTSDICQEVKNLLNESDVVAFEDFVEVVDDSILLVEDLLVVISIG